MTPSSMSIVVKTPVFSIADVAHAVVVDMSTKARPALILHRRNNLPKDAALLDVVFEAVDRTGLLIRGVLMVILRDATSFELQ